MRFAVIHGIVRILGLETVIVFAPSSERKRRKGKKGRRFLVKVAATPFATPNWSNWTSDSLLKIGRPLMNRKSYESTRYTEFANRFYQYIRLYNFIKSISISNLSRDIFWFTSRIDGTKSTRDLPSTQEGESGWNVLSARWLYYKLNRSAQLRGWCTKGIGVTTPRSIIRNDGAFPTIHGYLVFTGYKRTNTFVRTWHTYPKRSTYKRVFYTETAFPMGKVRGTRG